MIGRTVSHYRIVSHIGAGGMATVYLAEDTTLNRRVALKFLAADNPQSTEASARLLREARAASALEHPNIGTIYEVGECDGQPFIAMAYYEGETLAARLARGVLPMREAARIVSEIADALVAAHTAGVVHRDLKPSNLMLTSSGHVKVLDFGIATFAPSDAETMARLTGAGTTVGTAAYMSPEQASGREVDARSDLWSLVVVTRELLTGRVPFEGSNMLAVIHAVVSTTPPPIGSVRPDVAPELGEIVQRTMVADRDHRTITAADVRELAAACAARLSSGTVVVVPGAAAPRRRARVVLAAGALVVVAVSMAWWMKRNANVRWAREVALPDVIRLAGESRLRRGVSIGVAGTSLHSRRSDTRRTDPARHPARQRRVGARRCRRVLSPVRARRAAMAASRRDAPEGRSNPARLDAVARVARRVRLCRRHRAVADVHVQARSCRHCPARHGTDRLVDRTVSAVHSWSGSFTARRHPGLLDRSARGHQSRVQAVPRRWRVSAARAVAGTVREGPAGGGVRGVDRALRRHDGKARACDMGAGRLSCGTGRLSRDRRELVRSRRLCTLGRQVAADALSLEPSRRPASER